MHGRGRNGRCRIDTHNVECRGVGVKYRGAGSAEVRAMHSAVNDPPCAAQGGVWCARWWCPIQQHLLGYQGVLSDHWPGRCLMATVRCTTPGGGRYSGDQLGGCGTFMAHVPGRYVPAETAVCYNLARAARWCHQPRCTALLIADRLHHGIHHSATLALWIR